jgi:prepilin-type N-terminal cleavage/methylation domain-containing protein
MSRPVKADEGFTLIEVLIATVILGLGVAALIAGLGTQAKVSLANRNQSQAETTLTAAAEYVKSLPWGSTFSSCSGGSVSVPTSAVPRDPAVSVSYGPSVALDDQTPCSVLVRVPVHVDLGDFHLSTYVLKRPTDVSS